MSLTWPARLLVLSSLAALCRSRIHELNVVHDSRHAFSVESFGFAPGGIVKIEIKSFSVKDAATAKSGANHKLGFILRTAKSTSSAKSLLQLDSEQAKCPFDSPADNNNATSPRDMKFFTGDPEQWDKGTAFTYKFVEADAGLYDLEFFNCRGESTVNFQAGVVFANPGPDYLSVGKSHLPLMFILAGICFTLALVVWTTLLILSRGDHFLIHYLMWFLLLFKTLQEFFNALTLHFVQTLGHPVGWNIIYYFFTFLNGSFMFVVILLIGAGWSLLKPFLQAREKRILTIVIPLQILANIAAIYVGESAPGTLAWVTWRDIFTLVDIICCATVLFPLMWSLKTLRDSAQDNKMSFDVIKLKQFQHFYLLVVGYIYFSRIVVYLFQATMPYQLDWVSDLSQEVATFVFYVTTGYYFRPVPNNPYLAVSHFDEESEDEETASFGVVE